MIGSSLGLQPGEFASQYTRHIDGRLALKQSAATGDCAFLLNVRGVLGGRNGTQGPALSCARWSNLRPSPLLAG